MPQQFQETSPNPEIHRRTTGGGNLGTTPAAISTSLSRVSAPGRPPSPAWGPGAQAPASPRWRGGRGRAGGKSGAVRRTGIAPPQDPGVSAPASFPTILDRSVIRRDRQGQQREPRLRPHGPLARNEGHFPAASRPGACDRRPRSKIGKRPDSAGKTILAHSCRPFAERYFVDCLCFEGI